MKCLTRNTKAYEIALGNKFVHLVWFWYFNRFFKNKAMPSVLISVICSSKKANRPQYALSKSSISQI